MFEKRKKLKSKLKNREQIIGAWTAIPQSVITEILSESESPRSKLQGDSLDRKKLWFFTLQPLFPRSLRQMYLSFHHGFLLLHQA